MEEEFFFLRKKKSYNCLVESKKNRSSPLSCDDKRLCVTQRASIVIVTTVFGERGTIDKLEREKERGEGEEQIPYEPCGKP